MVSIAAVEKAMRDAGCVDREVMHTIRNLTPQPPVKPTKQEIVVAVLGQYDFQTQDLGIEELANEIVVRLDAADKEKCDG